MEYKVGDLVYPKNSKHYDWCPRLIVGYEICNGKTKGYLWQYFDLGKENNKVFSSLNSSDPLMNNYWVK